MGLKFPLQTAPTCLDCGQTCQRKITAANNANGNAFRPYYTCINRSHGWKFACWDDDRDILPTNPECDCGITGRGFKAHGADWYGCAVGSCDWTMMAACHFDPNDEVEDEGPLIPVKVPDDFEWRVTSNPGESPLCSLCRVVLDTLRGPRDAVSTKISPELRSLAGCHLCKFATRYFVENPKYTAEHGSEDCFYQYEYDPIDLGQASLVVLKYASGEPFVPYKWLKQATLACLPAKGGNHSSPDMGNTNHDSDTDIEDPLTVTAPIDAFAKTMAVASKWIRECDASHPNCQPDSGDSFAPTRVIDVGDRKMFHSLIRPCVRETKSLPAKVSYVTLSHCWGKIGLKKLETATYSAFMEHLVFDELPKTFQDAILVTQSLGVRYLWIDSLCIIQDSKEDWNHESALMVEVYKNAVCNLTAASSPDSSGGLFLDHDIHLTKPVKALFRTGRDGVIMHSFWPEDVWSHGYHGGPLINRGWILQERILSRRNLHFKRDQVAWECRSSSACETFSQRLPFREQPKLLKHDLFRAIKDPNRSDTSMRDAWDRTVVEYSRCQLTYGTDKLIAFGGIAHFFSRLFDIDYAAGLWVKDISYQLCWIGTRAAEATYRAPSWSWASTEGNLSNVFLPVHPQHVVRQLDVLEVSMDLASRYAYGQVQGGYLRVAGRVTTAKIVNEDITGRGKTAHLHLPNASGDFLRVMQNLDLSWGIEEILDAQQLPTANGIVYILEVLHHIHAASEHEQAMKGRPQLDSRRAPASRWLILVPVASKRATFQRCGTFVVSDWQWERYDEACEYFNKHRDNLPLNSIRPVMRYAITIV